MNNPDPTTGPAPAFSIPIRGGDWERATAEQLEEMQPVGTATACSKLHGLGIRRTFIEGPRPIALGQKVVGSALTLQFMPQREDVASGLGQEYVEKHTALWAVMETIQPGDVLVIQAYGSAFSGCIGDMLVRYFKRKGGRGIVVDGRVRDLGRIKDLGVPIWCTGATPHYASQSELFPWAYDVPVAVGGALCMPGDVIVADDDGAVVVPQAKTATIAAAARDHQEWEVFSRERLDEGARLSDYYPLTPDSRNEYEEWRASRGLSS